MNEQYKKSREENNRVELNLANPHFFQPKLHTILSKDTELFQENWLNKMMDLKRGKLG